MDRKPNQLLNLIIVNNPFNRLNKDYKSVVSLNETLLEICGKYLPLEIPFIVSVNGKVYSEEELIAIYPSPGDYITFIPKVEGGNNRALAAIAMIVIMVAAIATQQYWATALATELGVSTATATVIGMAGISIIGGLAVNALLPPQLPRPLTGSGIEESFSQAYGWNPQTVQQQGLVVPKPYGTMKLYGNIINSYLENVNIDMQYANALIDLGFGPISRLYDYEVNDQPIDNLKQIEIHSRYGLINQSVISFFDSTKIEHAVGTKVIGGGSVVTYTTIEDDFDGLEVDITAPNGLWHTADNGQLETYSVNIQIRVRKVGGTWKYITQQGISILVDQVGLHWSLGTWLPIPDVMGEGGTGPYYEWQEQLSGGTTPSSHYDGEVQYMGGVAFIWRWVNSAYHDIINSTVNYVTLSWNQQRILRQTFYLKYVPTADKGAYEIEVTNLTTALNNNRYGEDIYLSIVRAVYYEGFQHPRNVLVGLKALATDQLSGSLRFSCLCDGALIRVWNGSIWSVAFNNNPAWVCWDVLTQPVLLESGTFPNLTYTVSRYDGIDPSRLDLPSFYAWAQFCGTQVPNGNSGYEDRITFNGVFDTEMSLWEAAFRIAQIGRATLVRGGTTISVVVDKITSVSNMFTMGTINQGSFSGGFTPLAERSSELELDFINQDNGYERERFSVYDPNISGSEKTTLDGFGLTKPSENWRYGMYRLNCNRYLKRVLKLQEDTGAMSNTVGDVVNVAHDVTRWGESGLVVSGTLSTVTIDRIVTLGGGTYKIMIRLSDDTLAERTVTSITGIYTLHVSPDFPSAPQKYNSYSFGESGKVYKPFRITEISRSQESKFDLTMVEYNASIYGSDAGEPVFPTPDYSSKEEITPVTNLVCTERLITELEVTRSAIDITFDVPDDYSFNHADIWFSCNGGKWTYAGESRTGFFRLDGLISRSTYIIKVVGVNSLGIKENFNVASVSSSLTIQGDTFTPPMVRNLQLKDGGNSTIFTEPDVHFTWTYGTLDLRPGYEIYFRVQILINDIVVREEIVKEKFYDYTLAKNAKDNGTPSPSFTIKIWATTLEIDSISPAVLSVSNSSPATPSGLVYTSLFNGVWFSWLASEEPDHSIYSIRTKVGDGNWSDWEGVANPNFRRNLTEIEAEDYGPTAMVYIEVRDVDVFGQYSGTLSINNTAGDAVNENVKVYGVDAWNNDNFYWHYLGNEVTGDWNVIGDSSGGSTFVGIEIQVATDGVNGHLSILAKDGALRVFNPLNFGNNSRIKGVLNWYTEVANTLSYYYVGVGGPTNKYYGFKMEDGVLYGVTRNGGSETAINLQSVSLDTNYRLEARFFSGIEVEFYVNGVLKGVNTTNLPTSTILSWYITYFYLENKSSASRILTCGECFFMQNPSGVG